MTPAEREIAELDKSLAEDGEWVWLHRLVGTSLSTQQIIAVKCRAFVRGYATDPLIGGIAQQDSKVIMSPTQINRARWPGGQAVSTAQFQADPRVPSKNRGDLCVIGGKSRKVEAAAPFVMGGTLIRIEMRVLG